MPPVALPSLLLALAAAQIDTEAPTPQPGFPPIDPVAVELIPAWVAISRAPLQDRLTAEFAFGAVGVLRFATLRWSHVYWTVLEGAFGLSGVVPGSGTLALAYVSSELGYQGRWDRHTLQAGVAVGGGVMYAEGRDIKIFGGPVMASPTIRYLFQVSPRFASGIGLRAIAGQRARLDDATTGLFLGLCLHAVWTASD